MPAAEPRHHQFEALRSLPAGPVPSFAPMAGLLCATSAHRVVAAVLYRAAPTTAGARLQTPLCRAVHLKRGRSVLPRGTPLPAPRPPSHTPTSPAGTHHLWLSPP